MDESSVHGPSFVSLVALLVDDYDEAIRFYVDAVGFELVEDTEQGAKRWVVVRPPGAESPSTGLLLARAVNDDQRPRVGDQTGGRVFLFLETADFDSSYARMVAGGVEFLEVPRHEPYGTVAVWQDLYGNRWDLLQRNEG